MIGPPEDMTETPDPVRRAGMDALSDVLRVAHLTGGVFLHAEFFAPWCMAARVGPEHCTPALGPASHLILYHYVARVSSGSGSARGMGMAWCLAPATSSCCHAMTCIWLGAI